MSRQRRRFNVFSLAFLDVMSCGFGAVVLIFLIINHNTQEDQQEVNQDLLAELRMLDYQVQQGEEELFELIEAMDDVEARVDESDQSLATSELSLAQQLEKLADLQESSVAERESIQELSSDIDTRRTEVQRLEALKQANDGQQIRQFRGDGDRQYLTGLRVGGKNIVVAIDTSASMLDDTIVNVLRRRNMSEERQKQAPKWQRAVRTVEWIATQMPLDAEFQLYSFAEETTSLASEDDMDWIPMHDGTALNRGIANLKKQAPTGGSSLVKLVLAIRQLSPIPDNIYLITDGLPTQGEQAPRSATVSGQRRLSLFGDAVDRLPKQIPVNVIMFPMEGDPMASAAYWNVARVTGGAFISPSWDWP